MRSRAWQFAQGLRALLGPLGLKRLGSGCVIEDMARKLAPGSCTPHEARWHGGLAFDEMTHSRGLVFQKNTGRLIGWSQTDLHAEAEELAELLPEGEDLVLPEDKAEAMMSTKVLEVRPTQD